MVIIKKPAKVYKERRTRKEAAPILEKEAVATVKEEKIEKEEPSSEKEEEQKPTKKVELKDIEQKLDEILGE